MFSTSTSGKGCVLLIRCGANLGNALDPRPISCKTYRFLQKFRCQLMNSCSVVHLLTMYCRMRNISRHHISRSASHFSRSAQPHPQFGVLAGDLQIPPTSMQRQALLPESNTIEGEIEVSEKAQSHAGGI